MALVELNLVGHKTGAEAFVGSILQVPARHGLLHELSKRLLLSIVGNVLDDAPDLEVLGGIAVLVLGGALPCAQVSALGRESQIIDGRQGQ